VTQAQPETLPVTAPQFVRDINPRDWLAIDADTTLRAAMEQLTNENAQRSAVIDTSGRLLGIITDAMLLEALEKGSKGIGPFRHMNAERMDSSTVSEIMRRDVVTATDDMSIDDAIRLMTEKGLKRIPVIDAGGKFAGMIRRDSILIALSRQI